MILIFTHKKDFTADFLINQLNERKISYFRLNCEDFLNEPAFTISNSSNFEIDFSGFNISSIWFRRTQIPDLATQYPAESLYFAKEFSSLLENVYCALKDKQWVSDPFKIYLAENKILQLKTAKKIGFKVPNTLVTNSAETIKSFYYGNEKTVIKPLNSGHVPYKGETALFFTNLLNEGHLKELETSVLTPCIFQEYVDKQYELRITVVGEKVFSAKIDSQENSNSKVDWRRGKLDFFKQEIPPDLAEQCVTLCKELGLRFGAIDIIKERSGEYTFLEINPNGQWAWIEMETGLKISEAIIKELLHE